MLLATRSLDAATTATTAGAAARRARYRVQVHLDTDGGWLTPVNVGRTQRVVPHRTRVLVLDRDRGCRFPGCPTRASDYLEVHHRVHWRDGGLTDLENLLCLCTLHHDAHHRGEFTITGDPTTLGGLTFETRQGWPVGPPARPRGDAPTGASVGPSPRPRRPRSRLGRTYPAPTGGTLHLHLVDLTPSGRTHPLRR